MQRVDTTEDKLDMHPSVDTSIFNIKIEKLLENLTLHLCIYSSN